MKSLQERNDFEQRQLMIAYIRNSNRALMEKQKFQDSRKKQSSIDVIINQTEEGTEIYIPLKKGQKGSLTKMVKQYCEDTLSKVARKKVEEGEYKKFTVFTANKQVEPRTLAERINENQPSKLSKYNIELVAAYNFSFESEATYSGRAPKSASVKKKTKSNPDKNYPKKAVKHESAIPKNYIREIRDYLSNDLTTKQIAKKIRGLDENQVRAVAAHITMGTYEKPLEEITDKMQKKLFKEFEAGRTSTEVAEKYDMNKMQAIAQKAQYTRLKNIGEV